MEYLMDDNFPYRLFELAYPFIQAIPIDSICTTFFLYLAQAPLAHTGTEGSHSFELHEKNIGATLTFFLVVIRPQSTQFF